MIRQDRLGTMMIGVLENDVVVASLMASVAAEDTSAAADDVLIVGLELVEIRSVVAVLGAVGVVDTVGVVDAAGVVGDLRTAVVVRFVVVVAAVVANRRVLGVLVRMVGFAEESE